MQNGKTRRLAKGVTAGIAAALVAVPVAQARLEVDARHAALLNKAQVGQVDARHAALLNKAHVGQVEPGDKLVQMHRHLAHVQLPAGKSTASESGGIDWGDAGIGASAAFALALVAGGGLLVSRRRPVGA